MIVITLPYMYTHIYRYVRLVIYIYTFIVMLYVRLVVLNYWLKRFGVNSPSQDSEYRGAGGKA